MKIPLSAITLKPLRTSMDEEGLEELAQSIREHGLLEPIKLRQVNSHYELIDGHRRLEATRRSGATEIEAAVTTADEVEAMVQALILNVQREDLQPIDRAKALIELKRRTGWSNMEIERRGIMPNQTASRLLTLLDEPVEIQAITVAASGSGEVPKGFISAELVAEVRRSGLPAAGRPEVLQKAAAEHLTSDQARRVAEAVKAAPTAERKERLLKMPYSPVFHDPDPVVQRREAEIDLNRGATPSQTWHSVPEVRAILQWVSSFQSNIKSHREATRIGKLAPEAKQYVANRLQTAVLPELNAWLKELEE